MSSEDEDSDLSIINLDSSNNYDYEDSYLTRSDIQRSHAALRLIVAGDEDVQPASHHALTVAYDSLKKRYNHLQHQYRSVLKQKNFARQNGAKTVFGSQEESSRVTGNASSSKANMLTLSASASAYGANGSTGSIGAFVVQQPQQNHEKHKQILLEELDKMQRRSKELENANERLKLENEKLQRELKSRPKSEDSCVLKQNNGDSVSADFTDEQYLEASANAKAALHLVRSLKQAASQLNSSLLARCLENGVLTKASVGASASVGGTIEAGNLAGSAVNIEVEEQVATLAIGTPTAVSRPQLSDISSMTVLNDAEDGHSLDGSTLYFDDTDGAAAAEEENEDFLTMPDGGNVQTDGEVRRSDSSVLPYRQRGLISSAQATGLNNRSTVAEVRPFVRAGGVRKNRLGGATGELTDVSDALNEELVYPIASVAERAGTSVRGAPGDQKCPVCLSTFAFLAFNDFEQHVNDCMDRKSIGQQEDGPATLTDAGTTGQTVLSALRGSSSNSALRGRMAESGSEAEAGKECLRCEDCGRVFADVLPFIKHRENCCVVSLSERQCPVCGQTFDATDPQSDVDFHVNSHFFNDDVRKLRAGKTTTNAANLL